MTLTATEMVSHPLVVWAAWLRVDAWYRSGNLAPQPELSLWRLHPEAAVRRLAADLRAGMWRPSMWPQLPYPKRGACLRHYVMPTVKDQVAFMTYLVLIGPLLDCRFRPFVFGNRLYRPNAWNSRLDKPRWEQRRYPFLSHRTYLPYARSHGLFRRVASWTVSRMTRTAIQEESYAGRVHRPDNYGNDALPDWVQDWWWADAENEHEARAYWASVDIQLAYPSVQLNALTKAVRRLLDEPFLSPHGSHDFREGLADDEETAIVLTGIHEAYPEVLMNALADRHRRRELADGLMAALGQVRVDDSGIPIGAWRPFHARARLPPENIGLPTGLAVSGLLLNVCLHESDQVVYHYLAEEARRKQPAAVVRFADDMYLMASSAESLFGLVDVVWGAVEGTSGDRPIGERAQTNLHINLAKVEPKSVREAVHECLRASGWVRCEECGELVAGSQPASVQRWWSEDSDKRVQLELLQHSIGPGDIGPFVTTLVERLSEIGRDTLADRFGQAAKDRQTQLHDLARFDIKDEQVRADTRRTFAANRLAGAWLSTDPAQARRELSEIRRSIAGVFAETPWKFALWGAVVRAAARRVTGADSYCVADDKDARGWLVGLLRYVALHDDAGSWASNWPEDEADSHKNSVDWRGPYLSFHRTAFWQSLATVIRLLRSHQDRWEESEGVGAAPHHWATRAVPEGRHADVAAFLGDIDGWVQALYGSDTAAVDLPRWELDHFVAACLATTSRRAAAEGWRYCDQRVRTIAIPEVCVEGAPAAKATLATNGRLISMDERQRPLGRSVVAQLLLTSRGNDRGGVLFTDGLPSGVRGADTDASYALSVAHSFHCEHWLTDGVVRRAISDATAGLIDDPLALREYDRARRAFLSRGAPWRQ